MSYKVFALKWRPKNFDEIVGQDHVVGTLKNAIQKNRLANAYLFAGPRGIGKTSTARILAKSLNCKDGPTVSPCQKCASCLDITNSRSLDVIEIDGASNRGIDEIRVLRENVKFPPSIGKYKIYIIDEVHMLTTEAFNALLKTLEEPPEFVKFIFATTHPNKVLPTILSRCQRLDFRRIPVVEIIAQLEKIISAENIKIDKDVLFAIARSSDGALRDAESLLDQLSSFAEGKISLDDINSILGVVEHDALFQITDHIIRKDPKATLELFNKIIDEGKDINLFLSNLIEHFRNLMIAKITKADSKLIDLPQELCEKLLQQSQNFTLEEIFGVFNTLVNAQEMGKRLESARIPLEISLIKLAHDKRAANTTPAPVEKKAEHKDKTGPKPGSETKNNLEPVHEEKHEDKKESSGGSVENIREGWHNIVERISKIKMHVATYLNEGNLVSLEHNTLTISFPKNCSLHKESLDKKENKEIVEKIISETCAVSPRVNFVLSKEELRRDDAQSSPLLKSALDAFGARIIREII